MFLNKFRINKRKVLPWEYNNLLVSGRQVYSFLNVFSKPYSNVLALKPKKNFDFLKISKKFNERSRSDFFFQGDIKSKLNKTWSQKKDDNLKGEENQAFYQTKSGRKKVIKVTQDQNPIVDEEYKEFIDKYTDFIKEREKRRLNFNRKDRWKQREIDDIFKNFDAQKAKFKDYSKLSQELQIVNKKSFSCIDEVYYYLENIFKEGKYLLVKPLRNTRRAM